MIRLTFASVFLLSTTCVAADELTAVVHRRVHPVLIGNDLNSLLEIEFIVPKGGDTQVTSLTFSLTGTDDLRDIDALTVYYSADRSPADLDSIRSGVRYSVDRHAVRADVAGRPFDSQADPAERFTVHGRQSLSEGRNIFWLSCRLRSKAALDHRIKATCVSVQTTSGEVIPRETSQVTGKRIGIALRQHYQDGVHTSRIPALTVTPRGTLLCVYDMRRRKRRDLQEDIDIGLNRSTDGGQSWQPVRVIMDMGKFGGLDQNQNGCSDPGIVVDWKTGEIFCAAVWMNGKPGHHQWRDEGSEAGYEIGKSAQILMVRSVDDGITWSEPENLTRQLKRKDWILLAPSPQGGITLRDGTVVLPAEGRDERDRRFSTLIISRDHGKTWTTAPGKAVGNTECQVVEIGDGSLMLNARSPKHRSVWITRDLGTTWEAHSTHRSALIDPHCNGSLVRMDYQRSGRLEHLLCFCNPLSQKHRDHHTLQLSFDEGLTWPKQYRMLLDEGRGNGYPSMVQVDSSHLGIVYEGSQAHVVFERISVDELLSPLPSR